MAPYPTLPPFPDGLLECPLRRISLAKLCSEPPDADEAARLVDACETTGFFYLDLSDNPTNSRLGTDLIDNADNLVTVAKEAFKLPLEEKEQYSMMKAQTFFGYMILTPNAASIIDFRLVTSPKVRSPRAPLTLRKLSQTQ